MSGSISPIKTGLKTLLDLIKNEFFKNLEWHSEMFCFALQKKPNLLRAWH